MEQALSSSFRTKHIWDLLPCSPPAVNQASSEAYIQTLDHLIAFAELWLGSNPFLQDPTAELPQALAQVAETNLKSWKHLPALASSAWLEEKGAKVLAYLTGAPDARHPLAALLEDVRWPVGRHLRTKCKDIICTRIQGVYHRLTAPTTPNFAPRLKAEELEACATVWLGFRDGLDNLTRYQRLRLAVSAHTVSLLLNDYVPPSASPERSLRHQHLPSLTSRQQERSGVSEEGLRARWA